MYCASLCRSAIHAPRICNNIGQRFGLRRHRIFVPVTSPRSCNRCRIAGGTCREYTVQSVPARSRCSGIGSGHTSSISTNPSYPYPMQKATDMFLFSQIYTSDICRCSQSPSYLSSSFHRDWLCRKYKQMPTPKKAITKKNKAAPLPFPVPNKTVRMRLFCAAIMGSQI